ncbi:MAG: NADH-ubiquinone oxidoreductase-F iron-sulfur binding region domain-containing protein [Thermodesulfobacteriota bacterium]
MSIPVHTELAAALTKGLAGLASLIGGGLLLGQRVGDWDPVPQPKPTPVGPSRFTFCRQENCSRGAAEVLGEARRAAGRMGLDVKLDAALTACPGTCSSGPFIGLPQLKVFYHGFKPRQMSDLLEETTVYGRLMFPHLYVRSTAVFDSRIIHNWREQILVAMEAGFCLVSTATYLFEFNAAESCGKCFPCRFGVHQLDRLLKALMAGRAKAGDLELIEQLTAAMADGSYCLFAAKVTTPVRLALKFGRAEFERHLEGGCRPEELHPRPSQARG